MVVALTRLLRGLGWLVIAAVLLCTYPILLRAAIHGPYTASRVTGDEPPTLQETLGITSGDAITLARTIGIAVIAVLGAFLIALPAAFAAAARPDWLRGGWFRVALAWPMLAPPSVMGFAWALLATQKNWLGRTVLTALGWNQHRYADLWAGWMQANWLWPIPALALVIGILPHGLAAYRLALIDASPVRAFLRAALPACRGPALAAAALVFLLSINDASVPPLVLAGPTWSVMMQGETTRAATLDAPTAYLLWRSWPMVVLGLAVAAVLRRGLRPLLAAREAIPRDELGQRWTCGAAALWGSAAWTLAFSFFPVAVFVYELAAAPVPTLGLFRESLILYASEWKASACVAGLCLAASALAAMTVLRADALPEAAAAGSVGAGAADRADLRLRRVMAQWRDAVMLLLVILAVLPPVVIGHSLIGMLDRTAASIPLTHISLYDDTPTAPVLGVLCRYAVIVMLMTWAAQRQLDDAEAESARVDGASRAAVIACIRLPAVWRTIAAGAILVACLSVSELAVSSMVEPVRFGGSLAVALDRQIHFGRQAQVVATALLVTVPAMLVAAIVPAIAASCVQGTAPEVAPRAGRILHADSSDRAVRP